MGKSKVDYQQIRTLADVRAERMRIAEKLDECQDRLDNDCARITDIFRVSYLVERVTAGAWKFCSAISWAITAQKKIWSLIGKKSGQ